MSKEMNQKEISTKSQIMKLKKESEKLERMYRASCSHHTKKNITADPSGAEDGQYICRECGERFSMEPVTAPELITAIEVVHNAIQQIRILANNDTDQDMIKLLGEMDYNMNQLIVPLYKSTIINYKQGKKKKKNKNKNYDRNSYGNYGGYSSIRR